uniref:Uncharacterized protein n=1 Tax=Anguilla anguilla TaxID=7936 RepID=A0A0E9U2T6_ANGAN
MKGICNIFKQLVISCLFMSVINTIIAPKTYILDTGLLEK